MRKRTITRAGRGAGGLLLLAALLPAGARANDTTAFSWDVKAGTCAVTLDPATVDLGDVDPAPLLGKAWELAGKKTLKVNLNCSGLFKGVVPGVTVTGPMLQTPTNANFIFRSAGAAGGSSKNLGFVLKKGEENAGNNPGDIEVKNNEKLFIPKPGGGYFGTDDFVPGTYTIGLDVGIACGRTDWCVASNLAAGTVKGSATFTFAYP